MPVLRNDAGVFCTFDGCADLQAGLTKDSSQNRGSQRCCVGRKLIALIADHIADIGPGGPTAGAAEIVQRVLGHEKQDMGILLRADLQALRCL